jgi:hypothetical protein
LSEEELDHCAVGTKDPEGNEFDINGPGTFDQIKIAALNAPARRNLGRPCEDLGSRRSGTANVCHHTTQLSSVPPAATSTQLPPLLPL